MRQCDQARFLLGGISNPKDLHGIDQRQSVSLGLWKALKASTLFKLALQGGGGYHSDHRPVTRQANARVFKGKINQVFGVSCYELPELGRARHAPEMKIFRRSLKYRKAQAS